MTSYINPRTRKTWSIEMPLWSSPDDRKYVNLTEGKGIVRNLIDTQCNSLWRYRAALPLINSNIESLGEGFTPLIETKWKSRTARMKLEYLMPSGSFKDRGTAVMMNYLKQCGIDYILEDSSGNAGASIATYAAFMGMRCRIVVPVSAPQGKKTQIRAMGAEVIEISGTREDVTKATLEMAKDIFYAGHNYQPYFLEGTKTLAFELWEQLEYNAPDVVIAPLGQGSNVMGLHIGFKALLAQGQIPKLPRIYGVQAASCAPYFAVFRSGRQDYIPITPRPTIADGIASFKPVRLAENLQAMRETGGECIAIEEEDIISAHQELRQRGFYTEPTSAVAAAAFDKLARENKIFDTEIIVLILTGSGLKATDKIATLLEK
jgi:threonine synthase